VVLTLDAGTGYTVGDPASATVRIHDDDTGIMDVQGNGSSIACGAMAPSLANHTDFGGADIAGGTVTRTFTIGNSGSGDLGLTGSPRVALLGAHASDFRVLVQPASPIASGSSRSFAVLFAPGAMGLRAAAISIANQDSSRNPYTFAIQGAGTAIACRVTFDAQGGAVSPVSATVTVGTAYGTLPAPTRAGYGFTGWFTATNGSGNAVTADTIVALHLDHTLYARWRWLSGFRGIACDAAGLRLQVESEPGIDYCLQYSTNLLNWHTIGNYNAGAVLNVSWDPLMRYCFYRLRLGSNDVPKGLSLSTSKVP
jgi:uncharacterized repeat protein (TIGR02543 family)